MLIFTLLYIVMSLVLVNILMYISHPISLGAVLIIYSLLVGSMSMFFSFPWFFYLLVLVFLGGVMVLIIYMSTLSANEKFIQEYSPFNPMVAGIVYTLSLLMFFEYHNYSKLNSSGSFVSHIYEFSSSTITVFLMGYLLLTMISVVKLVKFEKGPLVARL